MTLAHERTPAGLLLATVGLVLAIGAIVAAIAGWMPAGEERPCVVYRDMRVGDVPARCFDGFDRRAR